MAHEITTTDGLVLNRGLSAWHGLGHVIEDDSLTVAEALELAGLAYDVERAPLYVIVTRDQVDAWRELSRTARNIDGADGAVSADDGSLDEARLTALAGGDRYLLEVQGHAATQRQDIGETFGVVGDRYRVAQNVDALSPLETILAESDGWTLDTLGSLRGGSTVFASVLLGDEDEVGGDTGYRYLLSRNTHDGSGALLIQPAFVRTVCANTLGWNLRDKNAAQWRYAIRHTKSSKIAIAEARETVGLVHKYFGELDAEIGRLSDQSVTDAEFQALVEAEWPTPARRWETTADGDQKIANLRKVNFVEKTHNRLADLWETDERIGEYRGTGWGAVQAFSTWDLWDRSVKGSATRATRNAERTFRGDTAGVVERTIDRLAAIHEGRELVSA